jgi:kanamycin kinase/aminoglycoside 3'-phosphotransferase-3
MEKTIWSKSDSLMQRPLPDSISKWIEGKAYKRETNVLRGSDIYIFNDSVLKITSCNGKDEEIGQIMKWLEGKIPVPKVIACETDQGSQYLLMSKVPGKTACDDSFFSHPAELLDFLSKALKTLWSVDVSDCPRIRDVDVLLSKAKYNVENNLADMDNVEPDTYGKDGFENPQALLNWLYDNKPGFEPVLSHGDFCLSNVLIENGKLSGFIDLGETGVGDKWRDIALLYRSLRHNSGGYYGGKVYPDINPDMLFDALGIAPDRNKLRFYTLLDELF